MNHETLKKIVIRRSTTSKKDLTMLKPVLTKWIELVDRYSSIASTAHFENPSACYWSSERSNVGVLASAAWSTGDNWVALEEFPTKKKDHTGKEKHGRGDLFMAKKNHTFAFEAKQISRRVDAGNEDATVETVRKQFGYAWNDIARVTNDEADMRIAACFVVPKFKVKQFASNGDGTLEGSISTLIKSFEKVAQADAVISVFPAESRNLLSGQYWYPGVCLLLMVRERGQKKSKK